MDYYLVAPKRSIDDLKFKIFKEFPDALKDVSSPEEGESGKKKAAEFAKLLGSKKTSTVAAEKLASRKRKADTDDDDEELTESEHDDEEDEEDAKKKKKKKKSVKSLLMGLSESMKSMSDDVATLKTTVRTISSRLDNVEEKKVKKVPSVVLALQVGGAA